VAPLAALECEYYLRFMAIDRPGVLARIAGVSGRFDISIASVIQKDRRAGTTVPIVIRTHRARGEEPRQGARGHRRAGTACAASRSRSASRSSSGDRLEAWGGLIAQYRSRMPVKATDRIVTLNEGNTPLVRADRLADASSPASSCS
jgi:hypothetical protein